MDPCVLLYIYKKLKAKRRRHWDVHPINSAASTITGAFQTLYVKIRRTQLSINYFRMSTIQEVTGFDFRLQAGNFFGRKGSGKGSTQPHEANWMATLYEKQRNPIKKTEIKVEG